MTRILGNLLLAVAICFVLAGCKTQLYGDLLEDEANLVLAALLDEGLSAEKVAGEENRYAVMVDEADFAKAMAILDRKGLPRRRHESLGSVFGKEAMFSTPMEERARYLFAMQEELSRTVSEIDGVLSARVHLVLPEKDQMGQDLHVPSAAVFVRHVDDSRLDPVPHRAEIRRLIAAAVPELAEDRIVVSFFPASRPPAPHDANSGRFGLLGRLRDVPPALLYAGVALAALFLIGLIAFFTLARRRDAGSGADKGRP